MAEEQRLPIHWGSVGFSLNVDVKGTHIALIMGYPRSSVFSQTIYTYFPSTLTNVKDGDKLVKSFKQRLMDTGLFKPAGNEVKHLVDQRLTEEQT
jgi:hypothetical protein